MKLVFYDEMPRTPTLRTSSAYRVSHWVAQSRELALKASDRASFTIRKKISKQSISAPLLVLSEDEVTFRRQQFRPLILSIHLPGNRLSDLPKFQDVDFSDAGEIQIPPKALLRSRSEDVLRSNSRNASKSTISMVGERRLDYWQQRSSSTTSQRPTTASSGLNNHPVSWISLPGLPAQAEPFIKALSPTPEEQESSTGDSMILEFPPIEEEEQDDNHASSVPPLAIQIPYKKPLPPTRLTSFNQSRISQWLSRSSSSHTTTTRTSSTSLEPQRPPQPQFYQCAITPPLPPPSHNHHSPTLSVSSASSPYTASLASMTSLTTAPTTIAYSHSLRSRSGTLKSFGKRVTVVSEEEKLPEVPMLASHGYGYGKAREVHFRKVSMSSQGRGLGMEMEMGVAF